MPTLVFDSESEPELLRRKNRGLSCPSGLQQQVNTPLSMGDAINVTYIRLCISLMAFICSVGCTNTTTAPNEVHVFAAASLTESFRSLATEFEAAHPHTKVRLHVAGSQVLALQLSQGAKADCYASANPAHIDRLITEGLLIKKRPLVTNQLTVVVPIDGARPKQAVDALNKANRIVVGHPGAPIGQYTESFFGKLEATMGQALVRKIRTRIVSREKNVRLVRAKVAIGVADAAIIYATDAINQATLLSLPLQPDLQVRARYYVAQHTNASVQGQKWFEFLQSKQAKKSLESQGFEVAY